MNEPAGPDPRPPDLPEAKVHFHLVLALIVPGLAVVVGWFLALLNVYRRGDRPAQLRWTRYLVALVFVDSLVAGAWMWSLAHRDELLAEPPAAPQAREIGLFDLIPETEAPGSWVEGAILLAPAFAAAAFAALWGRRRPLRKVVVWRGFFAALVASAGVSIGTAFAFKAAFGGWTSGGLLLSLAAQSLVLLAAAVVFRKRSGGELEREVTGNPPPSRGRVFGQALFYLVTGALRIGLLIGVANKLFFEGKGVPEDMLRALGSTRLGVLGTALFLVDVVILAPVAEEMLFRGYLLPRLAAQRGIAWALGVSAGVFALLHVHYLLGMPLILYYGLILGWARARSGGIAVPIALHMLINSFAAVALLLG